MKKLWQGWRKGIITITAMLILLSYICFLLYMLEQWGQYRNMKQNVSNCLNCGSQFIIVTVTPSPVPTKMDEYCATVTIADYEKNMALGDCECGNSLNVKKITTDLGPIDGKPYLYTGWVVGKAREYYGEACSIAFTCLVTPTTGALVDEAQLRLAECELRWFMKKTNWDTMESYKSNYWDNINELQKNYDLLFDYYNLSIQRMDGPPFGRDGASVSANARYINVIYISNHIDDFMEEMWDRIHELITDGNVYNKKTGEWEEHYKYKLNEKTGRWEPI